MKISCDVIQDLLPLYVDKTISEAGEKLVKEHLSYCPYCKAYEKSMKEEPAFEEVSPSLPEKKNYVSIAKRIRKKRVLSGCFIAAAGFVTAVAIAGTVLFSMEKN